MHLRPVPMLHAAVPLDSPAFLIFQDFGCCPTPGCHGGSCNLSGSPGISCAQGTDVRFHDNLSECNMTAGALEGLMRNPTPDSLAELACKAPTCVHSVIYQLHCERG